MRTPIRRRVNWSFAGLLLTAIAFGAPQNAWSDQVILDDLIVDGSICVGQDCVNGESFGFDTIRLKENNLRIRFVDTSSAASFPSNDWQLTANDSANGGANKFSIDDIDSGRTPFTVEAGARTNALYVESDGDIGIGTNNPVVTLHLVEGNTPTVRLEQDGSSGFTPQTWDLAGNEANFFIRDVTNGSKLPFRITPNTPTSTIRMYTDRIVINDGGGNYDTRIKGDTNDDLFFADASADRLTLGRVAGPFVLQEPVGGRTLTIQPSLTGTTHDFLSTTTGAGYRFSNSSTTLMLVNSQGFLGVGRTDALFPVHVGNSGTSGNGAHVTTGGVWTNGSSREFKENIKEVATLEARDAVMNLKPVTYNYKLEPGEQYAGFIAEDVPELVATNSRKYLSPMDIVSVVTKVVQDQQQMIERQQETISALSKRLEQLEGQGLTQE